MNMKNVVDIYPLSPLQQGMLFHSLYAPESGIYSEQLGITFHVPLDVSAFQAAWQQVVERHTILRTAFIWEGLDEPLQVVRSRVTIPWEEQDLRGLSAIEQAAALHTFRQAEQTRGFVLSQAPLMRMALLRLSTDCYHFVWSHHHLLLDGWSFSLILDEVTAFYTALQQGYSFTLPQPRPYRDYIAWLQAQNVLEAEQFWRQHLAGFSAPTPLIEGSFARKERISEPEVAREEQELRLSHATSAALQTFARQHQLTLNVVLQGAWALLLSHYSGETDVVFGTTVSTRPAELPGVETMAGLLINTLPVRVSVPPDAGLLPWLKHLQTEQVEARQYDYSSLVQIQGWSAVPRGQPLFESLLVVENYPVRASTSNEGNLAIEEISSSVEQSNYPLTLTITPDTALLLRAGYERRRFQRQTIARLLRHLETLLESIVTYPDRAVLELPLLPVEETQLLLHRWNQAIPPSRSTACLHLLLEQQVTRTPTSLALSCEGQTLTYAELNSKANQLARYLRSCGVGPDTLVGLCLERSLNLVVGLIAILKAGGAYLPLDPTYPRKRLAFMLADSGTSLVITSSALLAEQDFEHEGVQAIDLERDWEMIAASGTENVVNTTHPEHLAYVIYTSGSTGTPKGVAIPHATIVRLFTATADWFHFDERDVWTLFHSYAFDFSVWELWGALLYGGRLVVVPHWVSRSPDVFYQLLSTERVTVLNQTPSAFRQLLAAEDALLTPQPLALRYVIFGGEALDLPSLQPWIARHGDVHPRLINMYGITETTVHVTYRPLTQADVEAGQGSVIGGAIADVSLYILDARQRPTPIGVPGEIYVGGMGLARGYFRRPEVTAERFVPHLYSQTPGARLYRTGDLARYVPTGDIEYLGRIDSQVKIRGFRIELGEIEAALVQHPTVREAVVVTQEEAAHDTRLVAYIVPAHNGTNHSGDDQPQYAAPDSAELRAYLKELLPEYMRPSAFVMLAAFPLTPHGKVDRRALPAPSQVRPETTVTPVAPRNSVEETIASIWCEVLHLQHISVHDNFFDCGGHSLSATQVISHLHGLFQVELPLRTLFEAPTIALLAEAIILKEIETADNDAIAEILAQRE